MEATGSSIRYRANVTRNSKGYAVDWTVERLFSEWEMDHMSYAATAANRQNNLLEEVESFGAKLEAMYPATAEVAKPEKATVNGAS